MEYKDLITIIVPVYRVEKYLKRCVESILAQSYSKLEIILVDDGSDDLSPDICDYYREQDFRVKVIHKINGGLSSARNAGLESATGKYISFIDSDDYIPKDYIATLYKLIIDNSAEMSKVNYKEVYDDSGITESERNKEAIVYTNHDVERAFLDLKIDSACVFLYSKELIGNTRFIEGKTSEDIPFNFEIFQKAMKFVYLPVEKYCYYYNLNSISNGCFNKNMLNYLNFRKIIYDFYLQRNDLYMKNKSEVLYAKAAMGLMARIALYGVEKDLSEQEYKKIMKDVFKKHKKIFFKDKEIAMSRKILAILVFDFYPITKIVKRFVK